MPKTALDEKDSAILRELERDASQTTKQLARRLGLTMTTVHNRVSGMEKAGVIRGYKAIADPGKSGRPVSAYIHVAVSYPSRRFSQQETAARIAEFHEVEEAAIVTGDTDILVKVRTASTEALNGFITRKLRAVEGVDKTFTLVVLQEFDCRGKEAVLR
ncbi:MAG: Lrp/AsnC family transcriptional regulator [Candidatus Micrarchaeota archaeon]